MAYSSCRRPNQKATSSSGMISSRNGHGKPSLLMPGAIVVDELPFTEPLINATTSGGSPYGGSHVAGADGSRAISDAERTLARALGRRVAEITLRLIR